MATISAAETIQLQQRLDLSESANSTLRQANMDLFLKIPVTSQPSAEPDPEPDEKPSFDTLFKDGKLL